MRKALGLTSFVVFCASVLSVTPATSQTHNFWTSGASMPTAVFAPGGVGVLSGQIYVVGGLNSSNVAISNTQIYNPTTNAWSAGVSLPSAVADGVGPVVKGILYVIGGTTNNCSTVTNAVWAFNPKTKTWSSKSVMPTARCSMGVAVENNIIYVIGGYSPNGGGTRLNTVESYNPATDTWAEEAPLLNGKSEPSVGLLGNKTIGFTIVAADGFTASNDTGDNEGYNASANAWSSLTSDPTPRNTAFTGPNGLKLLVAGGYDGGPPGTPAMTLNESFNISTKTWKKLAPMPQAAMFGASATYKGLLYCIGGSSSLFGTVLNNVQIYHP
jgi:N-acetylneuraminic acid mutarotase